MDVEVENHLIQDYLERLKASLKDHMANPAAVRTHDVLGMIEKRLGLAK